MTCSFSPMLAGRGRGGGGGRANEEGILDQTRLFVHYRRAIFVLKIGEAANRPKLLSYCLLGFRRKDLETGVGSMGVDNCPSGTFPIRTRTKTRYRLVRGELHGEEGSGDGRRKTWIAYCLCSVSDLKMTIDGRTTKRP